MKSPGQLSRMLRWGTFVGAVVQNLFVLTPPPILVEEKKPEKQEKKPEKKVEAPAQTKQDKKKGKKGKKVGDD
ncbi:hypothetical protein ANCDUO_18777 [Ancylostoma duodenale]|uniref:Uncharacterized protein n=1 Tax=Ancylostoma duodenale TaxID=51022 RepID=A0A0C2FWX7_9BILA|nr:hypothetical protein ANCDUO_18777 [Ancylostoma duodenale]